jgi:hypothetical protein
VNQTSPERVAANEVSPLAAAAPTDVNPVVNGELLASDRLQALSAEERVIVLQSDDAFIHLKRTWERWKQVRGGLVVLRDLAMRETGANNVRSKLYKDFFHVLLEERAYCSTRLDDTTRKALLKTAELGPEIDQWHDRLPAHRRLRLNHPVKVLQAFNESQKAPSSRSESRSRHERELEQVRKEAAAAVASRDARITELQQQNDSLSVQLRNSDAAKLGSENDAEVDVDGLVQYVITRCRGDAVEIKRVIAGLTSHLEGGPS